MARKKQRWKTIRILEGRMEALGTEAADGDSLAETLEEILAQRDQRHGLVAEMGETE